MPNDAQISDQIQRVIDELELLEMMAMHDGSSAVAAASRSALATFEEIS